MLAAIHRGLLFAKVPLLDESTKGKLAVDCKSGRKLRHTKHVSSCFKYSNVFVLTLCMLGNVFLSITFLILRTFLLQVLPDVLMSLIIG